MKKPRLDRWQRFWERFISEVQTWIIWAEQVSNFDYKSNKEDAALNDDDEDFNSYDEDDEDGDDDDDQYDNDLILSTARVSASATFDWGHGDVDGVHVTFWL